MKREIKFKAFVKLNNEGLKFHGETVSQFINSKIHEVYSIDFKGKSICITDESGKSVETVFIEHCEIFEFLEFTGLKDKNGVDIYEGDILQDAEQNKYVILWDSGDARFVSVNMPDYILDSESRFDEEKLIWVICRVIGSVHSNPELIK